MNASICLRVKMSLLRTVEIVITMIRRPSSEKGADLYLVEICRADKLPPNVSQRDSCVNLRTQYSRFVAKLFCKGYDSKFRLVRAA